MYDRNKLLAAIYGSGYNQSSLSLKIGMDAGTLSRKIKTGDFRLGEMTRIVEALNVAEPETIFFAKRVAETATKGDT